MKKKNSPVQAQQQAQEKKEYLQMTLSLRATKFKNQANLILKKKRLKQS